MATPRLEVRASSEVGPGDNDDDDDGGAARGSADDVENGGMAIF